MLIYKHDNNYISMVNTDLTYSCLNISVGRKLWHANYLGQFVHIRITCPCVLNPLTPHFYYSKIGVNRDIHNFLILL